MMKGPEALAAAKADAAPRKTERDTTAPLLQNLRRVMRGIHWEYHKRQLDILELVCADDRQYQKARNQSLRQINEGEEVMVKALYAIFGQQAPADATSRGAKDKESSK